MKSNRDSSISSPFVDHLKIFIVTAIDLSINHYIVIMNNIASKLYRTLSYGRKFPIICYKHAYISTSTQVVRQKDVTEDFPSTIIYNRDKYDLVLVLPERLDESPETNELIRIPQIGEREINFGRITLEVAYKGLSQRIVSLNDFLTNSEEEFEKDVNNITLEKLFFQIEEFLYPMDCAAGILIVLTRLDPDTYARQQIITLFKNYQETRNERTTGEIMKIISNQLLNNWSKLSRSEKQLVPVYNGYKFIQDHKIRAIDESTITKYKSELQNYISVFDNNLRQANRDFSHTIDDPDLLARLIQESDEFQYLHHRERVPFEVNANTYSRFMQICSHRPTRQIIWQAYKKRCSPKGPTKQNNSLMISDIISYRKDVAKQFGYSSHLNRRLNNSMAKMKNPIESFLTTMQKKNVIMLRDNLSKLNEFASSNGFQDGIQEYDVDYWTNEYVNQKMISKSYLEIRSLFPLESVVNGICLFFNDYFGIQINANHGQSLQEVDRLLSNDSKTYNVFMNENKQQPIGSLIFNVQNTIGPLFEPQLELMKIRDKSIKFNTISCSLLNANYHKDTTSGKVNLRLVDIVQLVYYWSTALQRMLYNNQLYELNNENVMQLEAAQLFPFLCVAYILNDPRILKNCGTNQIGTNNTIDSELAMKMTNGLRYFKPLRFWHELYQAHLDLELHSDQTKVKPIADHLYSIYSPFIRHPEDFDYCSMDRVFSGYQAGSLYATIWSKQLVNFCLNQLFIDKGKMKANDAKEINSLIDIDSDRLRQFNTSIVKELFSTDSWNLDEKIDNLFGQRFNPNKIPKMDFI